MTENAIAKEIVNAAFRSDTTLGLACCNGNRGVGDCAERQQLISGGLSEVRIGRR